MRVYANVDMWDDEGMGFRIHSVPGDTVSLQNIDVEIRRIRLAELSSVLPYFPEITGLFSAEAQYVQTEKDLQLSAELSIDELTYERQRIGDVTLGATWLPGEQGKQYLNAYLNHDQVEVLLADGKLIPTGTGKDSLEVNTELDHFPLRVANVFVPDQMVTLSGDLLKRGTKQQTALTGQLWRLARAVFCCIKEVRCRRGRRAGWPGGPGPRCRKGGSPPPGDWRCSPAAPEPGRPGSCARRSGR